MNLKRNQIIYTPHGFASVKSVRSFNKTLEGLIPVPKTTRKKSRMSICKPKEDVDSQIKACSQSEIKNDTKTSSHTISYDFDFNFGEIFLLFEKMANIDENKFKVDHDGLIQVAMMDGSHGYISPKYSINSLQRY